MKRISSTKLKFLFVSIMLVMRSIVFVQGSDQNQGIVLQLEKDHFYANERIGLKYSGLPGNRQDWISLVRADAPESSYGQWLYTYGAKNGTYTFNGVQAGDYEIRVYFDYPNGGYKVQARLKFTVHPSKSSEDATGIIVPDASKHPGISTGLNVFPMTYSTWKHHSTRIECDQMHKKLMPIAEMIANLDQIKNPLGFDVSVGLNFNYGYSNLIQNKFMPIPAIIGVVMNAYIYSSHSNEIVLSKAITYSLRFHINDPTPQSVWGHGGASLSGDIWMLEPVKIGSINGMDIYNHPRDSRVMYSSDQFLLLISPNSPNLWSPVSFREYFEDFNQRLRNELAEVQGALDKAKNEANPVEWVVRSIENNVERLTFSLNGIQSILDNKDPKHQADLDNQAKVLLDVDFWRQNRHTGAYLFAGSRELSAARPLVRLNPDFFGPDGDLFSIKIVTVAFDGYRSPNALAFMQNIIKAMDWNLVNAMLD